MKGGKNIFTELGRSSPFEEVSRNLHGPLGFSYSAEWRLNAVESPGSLSSFAKSLKYLIVYFGTELDLNYSGAS